MGETEDGGYTDSVEIKVTEAVLPETYAITVGECAYGTITSDSAEAREGETITLTVIPEAGYILSSLTVSDEEGNLLELAKTESGYTFVMPASNVTVAAAFEKQEAEETVYYTLSFETNGGTAIDSISQTAGTVISLDSYRPEKEGYNFDGWYSDPDFTNAITEAELTHNMTVYAKWSEAADEETGGEDSNIPEGGESQNPSDDTKPGTEDSNQNNEEGKGPETGDNSQNPADDTKPETGDSDQKPSDNKQTESDNNKQKPDSGEKISTENKNQSSTKNNSPETGDTNQPVLWLCIGLIAVVSGGIVTFRIRKKK